MTNVRWALATLCCTACLGGDPLLDGVRTGKVAIGQLELHTIFALPPFRDAPMPVYLRVVNGGNAVDSLLGARSPASDTVMLHGMGMGELAALPIAPGDSLVLEPGGLHLMLMPPTPSLVRGDTVEVTLTFARTGEVTLRVPVIAHVDADAVR